MASIGFKAGDVAYSTEFDDDGWCTILEINVGTALVKLEDYDGAIVTIPLNKLAQSADADYNNWLDGQAEVADKYPSRPVEV